MTVLPADAPETDAAAGIALAAARLSAEPVALHNAIRVEADGPDAAIATITRLQPFHKGGAERALINGGILQALMERAMRAAAAPFWAMPPRAWSRWISAGWARSCPGG